MPGPAKHGEDSRRERHLGALMLHPLRQGIAARLLHGEELDVPRLAADLDEAPARIAYHLRVLTRHRVLKVVPRRNPNPPLYRFAAEAPWIREMLAGEDE